MEPITQQTTLASAGGKKDPLYVDDVFSTFLYDGTGGTHSINNGIDLSGEGGLVWVKRRSSSESHNLFDTERGANKYLKTDSSDGQYTSGSGVSSFNSNGFTMSGSSGTTNASGSTYASWNFRKAPGFFDVVTYTGNGTAGRTIAHNLGSVPGMIIIKCTSESGREWVVYHREIGASPPASYYLWLQSTNARGSSGNYFDDTAPTSSVFTLGAINTVNGTGKSYVAYIFAHDESDESIIKCGSYTGDGTTNDTKKITLGFEPQWVLIKRTNISSSWMMHDNIRGIASVGYDPILLANSGNSETTDKNVISLHPDGFSVIAGEGHNGNGSTYIYMAIRRPNKPLDAYDPPLDATDVFGITQYTGNNISDRHITTGGVFADLILSSITNQSGIAGMWTDRLRGGDSFGNSGPGTSYWTINGWYDFDVMDGYKIGGTSYTYSNNSGYNFSSYAFKRVPHFFDIATYTGNGATSSSINHDLNKIPELIITVPYNTNDDWATYSAALGASKYIKLSSGTAAATNTNVWNNTSPTSSVFTVGSDTAANSSGTTYYAYLFASNPGISKVGSYTGTGSTLTIDCGFTSGARFVLIKRSSGPGDWRLWDTTRGIVSGHEPYISVNDPAAETTGYDIIDPHNSGFSLPASGAANESGETYIFLAIA